MNALIRRVLAWAGLGVAAILLSACGGGGGSGDGGGSGGSGTGPGTLSVSLTDAPACGYDAVNVTVSKVRVHQSASAGDSEGGWSEISLNPARKINLLDLANGVLFELGQTALPSGSYQQIRLVLVDNATTPFANSVVPTGGVETELDTPSAQQSGLKLKTHFIVPAGQTVEIVLDFDACRSIVRRGNSGKFNLKPVIAVVPIVTAGSISGYVAAPGGSASPDIKVSAQKDGVVIKETIVASGAQFRLWPIAADTYDVVFTAAGRTTRVITGVPATIGGDTVVSASGLPIVLPAAATSGTVTGTVTNALTLAPVAASVRAMQAISATAAVEVASTVADGDTGGYSMLLPDNAIEVALSPNPWPTLPTLPTFNFSAVGNPGEYTIEASATGYLSSTSPVVAIPASNVDIALIPAP
jgi:hypothetical protein